MGMHIKELDEHAVYISCPIVCGSLESVAIDVRTHDLPIAICANTSSLGEAYKGDNSEDKGSLGEQHGRQ
jgi:hypothetical protein